MLRPLLGLALISSALAHEMAEILFPQIGQRGTTVELTLLGEDLHHPEEILFYNQGIKLLAIAPLQETIDFRPQANPRPLEPGQGLKLTLQISKNAPIGAHPFRLRTRDNLSELVRFFVTPLPIIEEIDPLGTTNNSPQNAQPVPLNSTLLGFLPKGPAQDDDWFKVTLEKDQRLTVNSLAARLGTLHRSGMNDASLSLFDPTGKEVTRNDDNALNGQDPLITFRATQAGDHLIHMRQQMDYETELRHYALHITDQPAPNATFPNRKGFTGAIESEGEVDWHTFPAKKGQKFRVVIHAATGGSELDPVAVMKDPKGNIIHEEDDSTWQAHDMIGNPKRWSTRPRLDPIFIFEPKEDGDYQIGISDKRRESSPDHRYHIEFQKHLDGAFIHFGPYPSRPHTMRDRIVIPRGSSASRPALIMPRLGNTYTGPLRLRAKNLPSGVTFSAPTFTAKDASIPILFHANQNAKRQSTLIELIAEPLEKAPFLSSFVQNIPSTNRRGDYAMNFTQVHRVALAIVEEPPFQIIAQQPTAPLVQKGSITLKLQVKRRPDFKGALYCEADWIPKNVTRQAPLIIPPNATSALYRLDAKSNASLGTFPISITARENEGYNITYGTGFHYVSTPFISLDIAAPFLEVSLERAAIERGKKGTITAKLKQLSPFKGKATLTLGNLPFGATQATPFPVITSADTTATFHLNVSVDCLVNQYKDIFCKINGPHINQQTGNGTLRVDPIRQ